LIRAPNPTKVKTGSRPRAPHELPLLTLTASRVIEMDEPAVATDSSGVPSAIEKSPLDFADEAEASGRETAAPEMPPPEEVPLATVLGSGQAVEAVVAEPPTVRESRKRGPDGVDANAPPKSLRRYHTDRPSGSSRGGKSLAAMQLCLNSNVFMSEGIPDDVSDPDPLAFAGAPSHPPVDVAQSSQGVTVAEDSGSENASSPIEVLSPGSVYRPEWGVTNGSLLDTPEACQDLVDHAAPPGYFAELRHMPNDEFLRQYNVNLARKVTMGSQLRVRFEQEAKLLKKSVAQELYPHMLTAIAGRGWVIGHGLRLAMMKCAESLEMSQAFADVVSAGVAKGVSEGLKHGVEHGRAQLELESIEAYDPEAEAKFVAALQSLKDLKFSLLDQLEGLKDAPMDVIMAALYLENDTGGMPHNTYMISAPAPHSYLSLCTR
nr:transposase (putative), gypsy type [Tanacetum cinerariifolium]